MKSRLAALALLVLAILGRGCEQEQEKLVPAGDPVSTGTAKAKEDPASARLAELVRIHSAQTFPTAGLGLDGGLTTLDYQDAMDKLRGKAVGFVALLDDVYRTENGYWAVFGPFELGFDAGIVLKTTEADARMLANRAHKEVAAMHLVIARFDALKVLYTPHHSVRGENGDDPDQMEVEEFGLEVHRQIIGELIAFEPTE